MYQEAIETNYSHEQMTPLNSIIGNSNIVLRRFLEIHNFAEKLMKNLQDETTKQKMNTKNTETFLIIKSII